MADPSLSTALENAVERELDRPAEVTRFAPPKLRGGTLQALHAEGRQIAERHQREWSEWTAKMKTWTDEHLRNVG